ncbi:hypothetical protein DNTS_015319, partial [Danionella cerebrum]
SKSIFSGTFGSRAAKTRDPSARDPSARDARALRRSCRVLVFPVLGASEKRATEQRTPERRARGRARVMIEQSPGQSESAEAELRISHRSAWALKGQSCYNFIANHGRGYARRTERFFGEGTGRSEAQNRALWRRATFERQTFEREIGIPAVAKLSTNVATRWLLRRVKLYLKGVGKSSLSSSRINSLGGSCRRDKSPQQISG